MSEQIQREIRHKAAEVQEVEKVMPGLQQRVIGAAGQFVAEWYSQMAESTVTRESKITRGLSDGQLSEIKARVAQSCSRAPEAVAMALKNKDLWWPSAGEDRSGRSSWGFITNQHLPDLLELQLREALGGLAAVLEPYGYLRPASATEPYTHWREEMTDGRPLSDKVRPFYNSRGLRWSDDLVKAAQAYSEHYRRASGLRSQIKDLETENERADSGDRWRKA
jgi:hypothetical protein